MDAVWKVLSRGIDTSTLPRKPLPSMSHCAIVETVYGRKCTMDGIPKPILYGVAEYAMIRSKKAWFVDRTGKIRDLEKVAFAVFLRPRRFGKSLWLSILEAYYDIDCANRFEELFAGTDIGANPTAERNRHLVLYFNFSAVKKNPGDVEASFEGHVSDRIDAFARKYAGRLPVGLSADILSRKGGAKKLSALFGGLKGHEVGVCCLIDEYDNFTNTILAESGLNAYNDLCHGDGFFKQFFNELKALTTSLDAPLKRLFITGVSPVTMDDVTSGFNIGTNISLWPQFADMVGFHHEDIRAMSRHYGETCGFDPAKTERICLDWFDNYRFGLFRAPPVANTTLVLSFFDKLVRTKIWPNNYIDENLRTDYAKIKHLVTLSHRLDASDRRLNGNFGVLENLVSGGTLSEPLIESFQANSLTKKENFTSLLYWLGITTIVGEKFGKTVFGIPNEALKKLASDMIPAAYSDIHKIDERVFGVNDGLCDFAETGNWRPLVEILASIVRENFAVRDAAEGEKVVQSTVVALLRASGGPYFVRHEGAAGDGYYDLALVPQFDRWPDIAHAALIELKYIKKAGRKPTRAALADIRAEAAKQLDRYAADPALAAEWRLKPMQNAECRMQNAECRMQNGATASTLQRLEGDSAPGGHVTLHRLVLVFKGGDCLLHEEV